MKNGAQLREVLRIHREQRSRQASNARSRTSTTTSSCVTAPDPANEPSPTAAVQPLFSTTLAAKMPSPQASHPTLFHDVVLDSNGQKRKRTAPAKSQISPLISKSNDIQHGLEDGSSVLNESEGDAESNVSDGEWEKEALWTVFASRYAELAGSEANKGPKNHHASADRERATPSTQPATSAASETFAAIGHPIKDVSIRKGEAGDPIEIE